MNIKFKITVKIILVIALLLASYGGFFLAFPVVSETAEAEISDSVADSEKDYLDAELRTEQVFALYHKRVEKIFDNKIKQLVDKYQKAESAANYCADSGESGGSYTDARKLPPCTLADKNNFSSACVAELVTAEYEGLERAMQERRKFVSENTACFSDKLKTFENHVVNKPKEGLLDKTLIPFVDAWKGNARNAKFEIVTLANAERQRFINSELKRHGEALELSLKAYDEFYWSYPLHIQYEETIKLLRDYNRSLIKIRQKVEDYTGRFENATTSKCT